MSDRERVKPTVIPKRKLGSIPQDTLVWVEVRDAMPGYEIDVECFQGISEYKVTANGDYSLLVEYLRGTDDVSDYGIEYRFWTDRPTNEEMEAVPWND